MHFSAHRITVVNLFQQRQKAENLIKPCVFYVFFGNKKHRTLSPIRHTTTKNINKNICFTTLYNTSDFLSIFRTSKNLIISTGNYKKVPRRSENHYNFPGKASRNHKRSRANPWTPKSKREPISGGAFGKKSNTTLGPKFCSQLAPSM